MRTASVACAGSLSARIMAIRSDAFMVFTFLRRLLPPMASLYHRVRVNAIGKCAQSHRLDSAALGIFPRYSAHFRTKGVNVP